MKLDMAYRFYNQRFYSLQAKNNGWKYCSERRQSYC